MMLSQALQGCLLRLGYGIPDNSKIMFIRLPNGIILESRAKAEPLKACFVNLLTKASVFVLAVER